MEFLNPAALYAFSLLPFLLIPYLIRRRPRRFVFSSLLLFRELSSRSIGRPWGMLRLPPIFFLQLLLLVLLILALGEPVFSLRPLKVAVILDNSASMQALEGGRSRFETAKDEATNLIRDLSERARVDLYHTAPRLERVGGEALTPSVAISQVAGLRPYDLGKSAETYSEELSRLAVEGKYERIFFITDHPVRGQAGAIKVISLGRPKENLAISSFQLTRSPFAPSKLEARVEVTNFSFKEEKIKLSLRGSGRVLSTQAQTIGPRKSIVTSFDGFSAHPTYEAVLEPGDALALDNRRFAVLPSMEELKIVAISPRPEALYSLRKIPGLNLKVISPEAYERSQDEGHSLEIFHFSAPASLPQKNALLVLPPKENPLVAVGGALSRPIISGWREPHPLTRYINFALFRPPYARPLKPLSFGETVIQSPEGPLAIGVEVQRFRYLVLGFDPFPFLGRENLPVSIFTLNLLQWLHEAQGGSSIATGEPLYLRAKHEGGVVGTPAGERIPIKGATNFFSQTFFQGFYEILFEKQKELVAVNFQDTKESDLSNPVPIEIEEELGGSSSRSFLFSLWPYLLFLSALLLLLEWFLNPPLYRHERFSL